MTGLEHYNVEAFAKAHAQLKELGAKYVYNPGISYLCSEKKESHEYWMRKCVQELTSGPRYEEFYYDLVVQLKGWSKSDGCRTEAQVASACGIPCVTMKRVLKEAEEMRKVRQSADHVRAVCDAFNEWSRKRDEEWEEKNRRRFHAYDHITEA
jgi:hypothetical protein